MPGYLVARVDPVRSLLAGVAAVIALIAAFLDANDLWMSFQGVVVPFLLSAAIVAAGLAILPATSPWSHDRRAGAAFAAVAWAVVGILVLPFGIAASGCACATGGPGYVPPDVLGMQARLWIGIATVGGPLLLLLAASPFPDRLIASRSRG